MGHSHGARNGTRYRFKRPFGKHGTHEHLTTYLTKYRVGDYVDLVVNGAHHKGMPYKFFHGRTGVIYNVSRRAVGVEINKQVRQRIVKKLINVRVEHVRPSKCRLDFLARVQHNEQVKREAKAKGERAPIEAIKRFPGQPKAGYRVAAQSAHGAPIDVAPQPFDDMM